MSLPLELTQVQQVMLAGLSSHETMTTDRVLLTQEVRRSLYPDEPVQPAMRRDTWGWNYTVPGMRGDASKKQILPVINIKHHRPPLQTLHKGPC